MWFIAIDVRAIPENAFLHLRDLHLSSGIAPMLPLLFLLAVGYIGIWVYLRRISSWESGTVEMPSRGMDRIFRSDCNHQVRLISRSMLRFAPKPWGRVLIAVVLNSFLIFRPLATAMDMLEPLPVRILAGLWFFLALLLLWSNWFRLIYI
jgi:hypothetical protein